MTAVEGGGGEKATSVKSRELGLRRGRRADCLCQGLSRAGVVGVLLSPQST